MEIAVVGTGFIGGILGRALANAGHGVRFGSRHPDDDDVVETTGARVTSIGEALDGADIVLLALPSAAVADMAAEHADALDGKLVIDATNRIGGLETNARKDLPPSIRYARAFNTLGGENMAEPVFDGVQADMFFSAPSQDRQAVESIISGVGLRPVYVGEDAEGLVDAVFRLWFTLAMQQGRGRRMAMHLLEG